MASRLEGDTYVNGSLQAKTLVPSAGCVSNQHVAAGAGIDASKLRHKHRKSRGQNGAASAETVGAHVVVGANATVVAFKVGSIGVCTGNATITVDLKKAGASILTAAVTLNSSNTARVAVAAVIASAALVAGDFLEVVVTVNAGTGALGTGLFWELEIDEDAQ
jgi:hypothetical protein